MSTPHFSAKIDTNNPFIPIYPMNLEVLFSPRSIAIIGASTKEGSVGHSVTKNILDHGYSGKVYPINPKTDTLFNLPCYSNISLITEDIDLAIIIIPAAAVPEVLREAGEKNIKAAIVISSGFKETGKTGKALEDEIQEIAAEYHIALLGPNCLGFLHPRIGLNASFAKRMPMPGKIAFFSQSGALCTALLDLSPATLGFSTFISNGNKAVIGENELLQYLAQDEETSVIALYSEGLENAPRIIETSRAILARHEPKPIIALKSGATTDGTKASISHTGALAGSDASYQALFKQARIIRATSLEHLLILIQAFSSNPLPQGNRIGIITNAGGLGVLATDAAIKSGLTMATLSQETEDKLQILPAAASKHNPVDVLGDALADRYTAAIEALTVDSHVDMLVVIVTPQAMTQAKETAEAIINAKKHSSKPIIAVFSGKDSLQEGFELLEKNNVTTVLYPEAGTEALASLAKVASWRTDLQSTPFTFTDIDHATAEHIIATAKKEKRTTLYETEVWKLLAAYGFLFLKSQAVYSKEEAVAASASFTGPLAMKIISPDITHKSDAGGVLLNVSPQKVGEKYDLLFDQVRSHNQEARLEGALLVEMAAPGGREIILGMKHEPGLGKLLMVGLGGIFVETFKDVAFRFSPLTQEDAQEMIEELKSLPLLVGTRGQEGIDMEALITAIGRLSLLVEDFPEIRELDINPLLTFTKGDAFRILDARIRLDETSL